MGRLLETLPVTECACSDCAAACKRPCWPTPAEAQALIDAGHAKRLMLDWWIGSTKDEPDPNVERVGILCGANPGHEGQLAPETSNLLGLVGLLLGHSPLATGCTFFEAGLCTLHDAGLKPSEGKLSMPCKPDYSPNLHVELAKTWETPEGYAVVEAWRKEVACPSE